MPLRCLTVLAVLALAGCDATTSASSQIVLSDPVSLALGETATIDGIEITFVDVDADHRCPDGYMCVWEGPAWVRLQVNGAPESLQVVDPEWQPEAGLHVGDRRLYATALTPRPAPDTEAREPVVTVATAD